MIRNIDKSIIALLISVMHLVISIGITWFTNYLLNYKHNLGIGLVVISSVLLDFSIGQLIIQFH